RARGSAVRGTGGGTGGALRDAVGGRGGGDRTPLARPECARVPQHARKVVGNGLREQTAPAAPGHAWMVALATCARRGPRSGRWVDLGAQRQLPGRARCDWFRWWFCCARITV